MSTVTMEQIAGASPRFEARIAGAFYLMTALLGTVLLMNDRLVVSGNAAATAANILAHEGSFRLGVVAGIISGVCYIAVAALFYDLFKPVNRGVSLLAAFFGIAGCTIAALSNVFQLAPLVVLKGAQYTSVFKVEQLQALALMCLKVAGQISNVAFVFFGLYCLLIGSLVFKSTFLPRALGVLMAIAGLCWLTNSLASFLSPPFARLLSPYILAGGIGELALMLWLLLMGVNGERWKEQAGAAGGFLRAWKRPVAAELPASV